MWAFLNKRGGLILLVTLAVVFVGCAGVLESYALYYLYPETQDNLSMILPTVFIAWPIGMAVCVVTWYFTRYLIVYFIPVGWVVLVFGTIGLTALFAQMIAEAWLDFYALLQADNGLMLPLVVTVASFVASIALAVLFVRKVRKAAKQRVMTGTPQTVALR